MESSETLVYMLMLDAYVVGGKDVTPCFRVLKRSTNER